MTLFTAGCAGAMTGGAAPSPEEIPALEADLRRDPESAALHARLGAAHREAEQLEEAERHLQRALEIDPRHAGAVLYLGLTYEDLERYADARDLYERYLEVGQSPDLRARIDRRLTLLERSEMQQAVRKALANEAAMANTPPQPRTVAVFPFMIRGDSDSYQPLGRALAEMLTTDLSQTDRLTVLERAQVQLLLDEIRLAESGLVDESTAARSGRILGAERVVQGLVQAQQEQLDFQGTVVRIAPGQQHAEIDVRDTDALSQLFELQKRIAFSIYDELGIELTPAERQRVNQRPTENVAALLSYGLGLNAADAGDYEAASRHFERAAEIDPAFTEAGIRAERAAEAAVAQETTTSELAQQGAIETMLPVLPDLDAIAAMVVPMNVQRDPAAEALGHEGVAQQKTLLEIIIQLP